MKHILLVLIGAIFLFGCNNPCPDCGCDNVDDCLSKYKFEEARKYAAAEDAKLLQSFVERKRVAFAEAEYWINEKDFKRALPIAKEIGGQEFGTLINEIITKKIQLEQIDDVEIYYLSFPERTFEEGIKDIWNDENTVTATNKVKYDLSIKIIKTFGKLGQFEKAESLLNNIPESIIVSSLEKNLQDGDEKLYYSIKSQLKENQKFYEPWQGYIPEYYHIISTEYPRKEALKIIKEYQMLKK